MKALEGTFRAVCINRQWGKTGTGKKQVALTFRLLSGPSTGRELTWFGIFSKKNGKRVVEALRTCGWKGNDLAQLGPLNQVVNVVVEMEEYQGKDRPRIQWINKTGGSVKLKEPMSDDELRKFSAVMAKSAATVPEVEGEVYDAANDAAPSGASDGDDEWDWDDGPPADDGDPGPVDDDDDIPF